MNSNKEYPLRLIVSEVRQRSPEIKSFILKAADDSLLPVFSAGAHLKVCVRLEDGRTDERAYSLVNSDNQSGYYEIAVKREDAGQGGSRYMHGLRAGDQILAGTPRNDFALLDTEHHAVLIAGGIGITPILSMARILTRNNSSFELHYGAREPAMMAYRAEIERLGPQASLYFDQGPAPRTMSLAALLGPHDKSRHVYVCGPKPLLDAVIATAAELSWPSSHVHFELFGSSGHQSDQPVELVLRRSGRVLHVPASQSLLDAMLEAGLDPLFDCKRGECGVCAQTVLTGTPDHRDYALSEDERHNENKICICVSRATSPRLTLDA
ncbi:MULTISPECIES: PDR/VanB family oxidoreductase [Pseudomonas]|uniref:PDR/VanB family oxidoreductase n=1 Tax=Pseudomonas guariconensis TaxID=1288410 RepID=UPI002097045E|nr:MULTISPECIES: PDR/VanB family oxidoreductase [Pseudomonas]MCO7596007.1 PDR/VanB family oxidoreductase [Pseudomonas guariconensis]MCU7222227.1 PDR/VanB family oxidoreductase [Pseudomonas brassicacearum]